MLLEILIVLLVCVVAAAIFLNVKRLRKSERMMYRAAGNILKNEFLNYSLHNPMLKSSSNKEPRMRKPMLYIKTVGTKPLKEYVFDPETVVKIGRSQELNSIVLNEAIVSIEHCFIFLLGENIVLRDCASSNGTFIRRGSHSYIVSPGQQIVLKSGDVLKVGSTAFKIKIFLYDMTWM
ncbi:MAG: FHA domain-containing protein [Ruminococcus sp.]|nr:FHA domain-containing protein [Ruminococcus sp.]